MKRQIAFIASCWLLLGAVVAPAQVPQVLGVWELDVKASELPKSLFPAGLISERRSYYQRDDGYLSVLAIRVNGNGTPDFIQVVARSDGKDYPQYQSAPLADWLVNGTRSPFTYSETIIGPNTAEVIAKRNGQVSNRGTRTISADGKTMTLKVEAVSPDGQKIPLVLVFRKQEA